MGDFVPGRENDSDETEGHVKPARVDRSVEVPASTWVDVPVGMTVAPGTYVDEHGVLRSTGDHSCVVWHRPGCLKKGIKPEEIVYQENGAPWCPVCVVWDVEKVAEMATMIHGKVKEEKGEVEVVDHEQDEEQKSVTARLKGIFGA